MTRYSSAGKIMIVAFVLSAYSSVALPLEPLEKMPLASVPAIQVGPEVDPNSDLPADFDIKRAYREYTYESLTDYVSRTLNVTDAYVGAKVKLLATTFRGGAAANTVGLHSEILRDRCDSAECVGMNLMVINSESIKAARFFPPLTLHLAFKSQSLRTVISNIIDQDCKNSVCYVAVAGKLGAIDGEHQPWGLASYTGRFDKTKLVFITIENIRDIRIYKSNRSLLSDWIEVVAKAVKETHSTVDPWLK